jgi:hypothetical protein
MVCLSYGSDFEVARNCCVLLWFLETKTGGESLFWKEVTDGGVTTIFLWHGMPAKIQQILANAGHNMARVAVNSDFPSPQDDESA